MRKGKQGSRIRNLYAALLSVLLFLTTATAVSAEVSFSVETAGEADSMYVAGNPDFYPVEYYNSKTGCYEGVMPELLEIISEQTNLNFTYISSGDQNQQLRLAKNGQVEILSAYLASDEETEAYLAEERVILSIPVNGEMQDVCLAFTSIASDELIDTVTASLDQIPDSRLAEIAVSYVMEHKQDHFPLWVFAAVSALCGLMLTIAIIFFVRLHKHKKQGKQDKLLDLATGIGNKAYFSHYFENLISDQNRALYFVAYIAFDISHSNQYYGQEESENILRFAADVLTQNAADTDIIARITGGGFGMAFQSGNSDGAKERMERLLHLLNQYSQKYNRKSDAKFCAGVYSMTQSDRSCETVLYNAQQGYIYAVENDLSFSFINESRLKNAEEQLQLQRQIAAAFKNSEFKLYLQFIVDKSTKEIIGAEALSRWQHPQRGLLLPRHYINIMEHLGNISDLDLYIFEEVCKQLEKWKGNGFGYLTLSCNFTRITISSEDFIDRIHTISGKYSFDHSKLIMEITEDIAEKNEAVAFKNIAACKKAGYQISLDDFGEGYTSFSNLCDYYLDYIKIDKNIVHKAETSSGKVLLNGMITLGHSMGMKVICEGVETERQNELVCNTECDQIQGYYYFRAIPQEETTEFLKRKDPI